MEEIKEETKGETKEKNKETKPLNVGEIIQAKIIGQGRASVFLDLGPCGSGIIFGKEFYEARNRLRTLKKGDTIFVKVVDLENEDGYIELSLTKEGKDLAWDELSEKKEKDEIIKVKVVGANKGGLLAEVSGIPAFLPVSQLSPSNYPKVEGGDVQKILRSLQKFIGQELEVKIFDFDKKEDKLILSEKAKEDKRISQILESYKVGDIIKGEITGIVDFGAFVKIDSSENDSKDAVLEGLIHISELDWQLIKDPSEVVKVGQKVKAKIIDISDGKVSLSLKVLKKDPWEDIDKICKKNDVVKGEIVKFNPFGAFVKILPEKNQIQGLCHISEFGTKTAMEEVLELGKNYKFQVLSIDPAEHRMSLKFMKE